MASTATRCRWSGGKALLIAEAEKPGLSAD
jgi:hypothetical protein